MPAGPDDGIRLLGDVLPYADGAEDRLLEVMSSTQDRSALSDELPEAIVDWPTRYHLSRLRANLLRPLAVPEGARVLDVGAGTGALSRHLGERGASVVALEGSLDRARVAAERCRDLPNVEVVCGPLGELDDAEGFDLVVVCGVLEYAHAVMGGDAGADAFLSALRRSCRDDGAMVLAIENRLGLKYLLGYAEDHLGRPWIGLEGYPDEPGVRTWSRAVLGSMLTDAGFDVARWLFPFPDYKLPVTVLSEAAYRLPDAARFVDQLVGTPVLDLAHPPVLLTDDRAAHRSLLEGGLGPEVANSLVAVAGRPGGLVDDLVDDDVLAWRFGDERCRAWLRTTVVHAADGERRVRQVRPDGEPGGERRQGWLRQALVDDGPYVLGDTLQQQALDAARRHDLDGVRDVLVRWRHHLRSLEQPPSGDAPANPFRTSTTVAVLPEDHLDVALDNFVDGADGLRFIDPEWHLAGGVDAELAVARSLWGLARTFVTTGVGHPWADELTVDELAAALGAMAGAQVGTAVLERWWAAEAELQHLVRGEPVDQVVGEHRRIGQLSRLDLDVVRSLPVTRLMATAAQLGLDDGSGEPRTVREALAEGERRRQRLDAVVAEQNATLSELRGDLGRVLAHGHRLEDELEKVTVRAGELEFELGHTTLHAHQLEDLRDALTSDRDRWQEHAGNLERILEQDRTNLNAEITRLAELSVDLRRQLELARADADGLRATLEAVYARLPYRVYAKARRSALELRRRLGR